jgi:hypothetical protein
MWLNFIVSLFEGHACKAMNLIFFLFLSFLPVVHYVNIFVALLLPV